MLLKAVCRILGILSELDPAGASVVAVTQVTDDARPAHSVCQINACWSNILSLQGTGTTAIIT